MTAPHQEAERSATTPPHHRPDGTFRNPWPGSQLPRSGGLLKWWWERRVKGVPPDPDPSVFERVEPSFATPRASEGELTATWIGHSTVLLQMGGKNLLTDPMFSERASPLRFAGPRRWTPPGVALDALPPIDMVLLSHNHYDHLDVPSVRKLAKRFPAARWVVPLGLGKLLRRVGVGNVSELDWWDAAHVDGVAVTATPAAHFSARHFRDRNHTLWCGFAVESAGRRVYFAGDTGYHPEFALIRERAGPFDLMLLPIGAYEPRWFMRPVHMNPEEAVRAFVELGGREGGLMGGIHWGTFKLTDEPMDEPPRVTAAAWEGEGLPAGRLWVPRVGETVRAIDP